MKGRAVYIRGVGAITPLGESWSQSVVALANGRSAIGPVTVFDTTGFPCTVAAQITAAFEDSKDRRLSLARRAAREAWKMAGLSVESRRLGVFIGAESGRATFQTIKALSVAAGGQSHFDYASFGVNARPLASRIDPFGVSPASVASVLAKEFHAHGPAQTVSLACASGAVAIAEAARAIRQGVCDVALCGGVGADVDPLMLVGFGRISALSVRGISCPFDVRRDGFVVGEGAAFIVLSAERGGAEVELAGEGRSLDAYHLTAPDPLGKGAERAMRAALLASGGAQVDYVQAHGTSTPLNDTVESQAIGRVLGEGLARAHVSSVKGALGHWIAGAGALGFLCGYEAIHSGTVFPTAGLAQPDSKCALPHVVGKALHKRVDVAMVNAFAFGGANCSLVLRRCA